MNVDPRGSVTEISDEMLASVGDLVERGCTVSDIMEVFGISPSCSESWSRALEALPIGTAWEEIPEELQRYMVFMRAFSDAMRSLKVELFGRVYSGSSKWSSASWLLQRKFPEEFHVSAGAEFEPLESRAPTAEEQKAMGLIATSDQAPSDNGGASAPPVESSDS